MTTKDERLARIVNTIQAEFDYLLIRDLTPKEEERLTAMITPLYDQGFADGCTAGMRHQIRTQQFINDALLKERHETQR